MSDDVQLKYLLEHSNFLQKLNNRIFKKCLLSFFSGGSLRRKSTAAKQWLFQGCFSHCATPLFKTSMCNAQSTHNIRTRNCITAFVSIKEKTSFKRKKKKCLDSKINIISLDLSLTVPPKATFISKRELQVCN